MKIVIAIDSLKGCLSSYEAAKAIASGLHHRWPRATIVTIPVSDGGEGMLEAFAPLLGAERHRVMVHGPMMRPVEACYAWANHCAVIESAQAIGLHLVPSDLRNPLVATTMGVGELMGDAVRHGARHFIVGLGGSGTSDCGWGMLKALRPILKEKKLNFSDLEVTLASDVTAPLYGSGGAAHVFGPQKGATAEVVEQLDRRARRLAEAARLYFGYDCSAMPGAGAAGGLGYAFMQWMGAEVRSGADLLLDVAHFERLICDADIVITGEGKADAQTLLGKLPEVVRRRCARSRVPVVLVAGQLEEKKRLESAGFFRVINFNPPNLPLAEAIKPWRARQQLASIAAMLPTMNE